MKVILRDSLQSLDDDITQFLIHYPTNSGTLSTTLTSFFLFTEEDRNQTELRLNFLDLNKSGKRDIRGAGKKGGKGKHRENNVVRSF